MGGDSEYEPKDSRKIEGGAQATGGTRQGRWGGEKSKPGHGGEYEPRDSRNIEGNAGKMGATKDGRWTKEQAAPPLASDEPPAPDPLPGHTRAQKNPTSR